VAAGRVLFHVQHLLGIGHQRRAASLVRAMLREGLDVTILSGGDDSAAADHGDAAIVRLPAVRALDATFALVDETGRAIDDAFRARRRALVLDALSRTEPAVLLIEGYPFARRAFRFELDPLIAAATNKTPRPAIVASVRDVLVEKANPERRRATVAAVQRNFDLVLVHGDPRVLPFGASFPETEAIAAKLRYTGYVRDERRVAPATSGSGEVIVSVGGGAVGGRLLTLALAARSLSRAALLPWRLLAGPNLPAAAFAALAAALPDGATIERFRDDFPELLRCSTLSISQAGYNTVLDILAAGTRAIVVPFAAAAETEQTRRAERLAELGLLRFLREDELSAERLAAAIDASLAGPPPPPAQLDLAGAATSARWIAALARGSDPFSVKP
jgi:predicted glycosyltransferase